MAESELFAWEAITKTAESPMDMVEILNSSDNHDCLDDNWRTKGSVRRSPRLAGGNPYMPTLSPVKRLEKLQVRRKLSTLFVQEQPVSAQEEQIVNAEEVDDEEYWSEDSQFSQLDIRETEVEGDLVEEEELFSNGSPENMVDVVNKNINHSCSRVTCKGKAKLINVDDLDVRVGEEIDMNSDEDNSVAGSGDEDNSVAATYDTFDPAIDFGRPIVLKKGLKFPSVEVYRKAVRQHAIENGYEPYFQHNDSTKVRIYCRHRCECPWNAKRSRLPKCTCGIKRKCKFSLYATKLDGDTLTFQIRTLYLDHVCVYTTKNRMVTSEWIASKYLEVWRSDPHWTLKGVQSRVKLDYGVDVGYHMCWVARARAKMMIEGNSDDQYRRVWDYVFAIMKYNPGSSAYVKVDRIDRPPPIFQRMYICLAACKEGFVKGCRPLLGVDGCHLKGMYPGMCLVAVAMDGNNNIFPVAWGVVEVENARTWEWFLDLLVRDIGSDEGDGLTFMSDRQKGLIEAMNVVVPRAEIRYCVRHIWANFKLQFTGQAFKDSFWRAAWATTEIDFKSEMEEIKNLSEGAYNYLSRIAPRHWSRHAFSTNCKSSMILNNLCETFNSVLKDARDKPILTHMEWMRRYVMKRNFEKREGADKYEGKYMPYIQKCFKRLIAESRYAKVHSSVSTDFEVDYKGGTFTVNLVEHKCNCFHWELTGIPCTRAMACILQQRQDPEDFVNEAYSREKYLMAYSPAVKPMPDVTQWDQTGQDEPLPPVLRRMPGRPSKKKRRKESDESTQVKRTKKSNNCGRCGGLGHNKKTCKNPPSSPKQRNKGGRPPTNSSWVNASKGRAQHKRSTRTHDEAIVSQTGSQPSSRSIT